MVTEIREQVVLRRVLIGKVYTVVCQNSLDYTLHSLYVNFTSILKKPLAEKFKDSIH